jgi:hypothetical protein
VARAKLSPLDTVAMPARIKALPKDDRGYPVPYFVTWRGKTPSFPEVDTRKLARCVRFKLCWICGQQLGAFKAFVVGPMCVINRISSEPPSHRDCAIYALRVCPFLVNPRMRRVPFDGNDERRIKPPGIMVERNPGTCVQWMTTSWQFHNAPNGKLFAMNEPTEIVWWHEGREATAQQAADAFTDGAQLLLEVAHREAGEAGVVEITQAIAKARQLLPAPDLVAELVA